VYKQSTIDFDQKAGESLSVTGMELAVETANAEHSDWSTRCWQLFRHWLQRKPRFTEFMIEDFRKHVYEMDLLERPMSDRAFGFLSKRAVKEGLIMFAGIKRVKNKKAHATPANAWAKR
jgi:hypothetical protein